MAGEIVFKIHRHEGHLVLAAADKTLIGRTLFRDPRGDEPFTLPESFYGEEAGRIEELREAFSKATICNIVGKNSLAALDLSGEPERMFFFDSEGKKIPHVQQVVLGGGD
jgi:hypothetical protein